MEHRPSHYGKSTERDLHCPRCQGGLVRIRRRPVDRLVSVILPRRRYRCVAIGCGWEGTLRAER
jgi:hypothetical protein